MKQRGGINPVIPLLLVSLLAAALWFYLQARGDVAGTAAGPDGGLVALTGSTMGTSYRIIVHEDELAGDTDKDSLKQQVQTRLDYLDRDLMSTYSAHSQLMRLNGSAAGTRFTAAPELIAVFTTARRVYELSGGALDITVKPLVDLWGFGAADAPFGIPAQDEIDAALAFVGMDKFTIDPAHDTIIKNAGVQADLSAVAKGYAVDRIADLLESRHLRNYLVEIGGELIVRGVRKKTAAGVEPWKIGIETPQPGEASLFQPLRPGRGKLALAGSGSYRNFFDYQGKRYSHTIDPATGRPVDHNLVSVTVVAETAALADAWATALMVLGTEAGMNLANKLQLAAYFISADDKGFTARHSDAFGPYL